jgi:hypothetical protein
MVRRDENGERSEAIRRGMSGLGLAGSKSGDRERGVFDRQQVVALPDQEKRSLPEIARRLNVGVGTVKRAYDALTGSAQSSHHWG